MSMRANLTTIPDSLFSLLTHLKHEELITGDSDCKLNLIFFSNDMQQRPINGEL